MRGMKLGLHIFQLVTKMLLRVPFQPFVFDLSLCVFICFDCVKLLYIY